MKIYDDGWYFIIGIKYKRICNCHYFLDDKPLHSMIFNGGELDYSKRRFIRKNEQKRCKRCLQIIHAYRHIGLENRLI